ncbi:hypothetical protein [Streptomyces antarcticus]|uniref:hypothetical protein n=1 Tax=Streptomyces antarcticus TaxID=2996458 RepID=UPI00226E39D8|nr:MULTISPECIES: hypothetical protein [unclassified Streptomyces]MCY0944653.1 hypothetical protein [Streptomyces sp. H34-AA3]MCZ4087810.1 hypothetical protein [Streptomyces sp. H34-S5]
MTVTEKMVEAPDPAHLAAVLRRRQAMRAQLDQAEVLYEDVNREAGKLLDQQYQATRSTKADVTLDDDTKFANVTRVGGEAEAQVIDREAFAAWVRDTYPDQWSYRIVPARTETVVDETFAAAVLAAVDAAGSPQYSDTTSGLVHDVPGVMIKPTRSRYYRWTFTRASKRQPLDGRELVANAVQAGQLDLDAPLAIEAAPAEAEQ